MRTLLFLAGDIVRGRGGFVKDEMRGCVEISVGLGAAARIARCFFGTPPSFTAEWVKNILQTLEQSELQRLEIVKKVVV